MSPFFSIIIPVYNAATYIKRCVHQIINQSYQNYEIIFINDGSTDNSSYLLDIISKECSNIKIINQSNLGPGTARNVGIETARGNYLLFLDIDDEYHHGMLQTLYNNSTNSPDVIVYNYIEYNLKKDYKFKSFYKPLYANTSDEIREIYSSYFCNLPFSNGFCWNRAYNRHFINKHDIKFGHQRIQEDELFNLYVYRHAQSLRIIADTLYTYIIHKKNSIFKYNPTKFKDYSDVHREMISLIKFWSLQDNIYVRHHLIWWELNAIFDTMRNYIVVGQLAETELDEYLKILRQSDLVKSFIKNTTLVNNNLPNATLITKWDIGSIRRMFQLEQYKDMLYSLLYSPIKKLIRKFSLS